MSCGHEAVEEADRRQTRTEDVRRAEELREAAAAAARHLREAEARAARRTKEAGVALRQPGAGRQDDGAAPSMAADAGGAPPRMTAAHAADGGTATEGTADASGGRQRTTAAHAADGGTTMGRPRKRTLAEAEARLDQRVREVEAAAQGLDAGSSLAQAIAALMFEAVHLEDGDGGTAVTEEGDAPRRAPRVKLQVGDATLTGQDISLEGLAFWAALFAALQFSQWVVIALSREYHDVIAREASLLTGVEPEDEPIVPRVHVDLAWLRKKVKRRWRAMLLFAVGFPALLVLSAPVLCNSAVLSALSTAWGAYWLVVFTAAKSARAWEAPASPHPPWFLRTWTWLTTRVPGLRWGVLQRYGAFWARRTQEVLAPVATVERHPWAFAGLAVVRFIGTFPPMKFFIRPLIPVASAHLLAEEAAARAALNPPPEKPMIPAGETGA
nr:hypothetical protein [Myxococcus sp. RHSTA-1-4]